MGRRGVTKQEGGHVKFYPMKRWRAEKVLAMLKGGHKKFLGVLYMVAGTYSHINGGAKRFHSLKGGRKTFHPVLRGGVKSLDQRFSHFVAPPPPST